MTAALASESLDPAPFSSTVANVLHTIFNYIYLLLLIIQFILALGNRPQGSKLAYTASFIGFAALMIYMIFATLWITVVGVQSAVNDSGSSFGAMLGDALFRNIIVSLLSTYALYLVASILFLDPWHMFTRYAVASLALRTITHPLNIDIYSSIQYILLSPSYTNILNIYAFCNTHDVSWGTKGDTQVKTDLGVVKTGTEKEGDQTVEVEVPTNQTDVDEAYEIACMELQTKPPAEEEHCDPQTKQLDYYRTFRTRIVLTWIISNLALVVAITNSAFDGIGSFDTRSMIYLGFILWSVAALSLFRFLGSCTYLIIRIFTG